ncbi:E3 ubiquitin-protein ligase AIRP1-like [Phoenix dactylifera]|uniref:RING-type E3 ubiquitin transferase n=1 Tax=Phoenix dactylifera TaxID=42345 RepID=A0A8B8J761_PHODC|nr:E3 ubiquitin-protein ligase AIRP1-like [Phoenix dactylifera]
MGSSSSRPRAKNNHGGEQRSAAGASEPPIQRSGNQISSSNQDKTNNEQPYQQQLMRSDEANVMAAESFSEITISGNATQRTEPLHTESKNEKMVSSTHKGDTTPQKETRRTDAQPLSGDLDDKECPICLEEYDIENPKLILNCRHHYHMQCILQWMERSATCPTCNRVMTFDEIFYNQQY